MIVLTDAERFSILCGSAALMSVVVLLTACFVCPMCCIYKFIHRRRLKEDEELKSFKSHYPITFLNQDPPPPYEPSSRIPFFDVSSFNWERHTSSSNVSTVCSDPDIPLSALDVPDALPTERRKSALNETGNVSISLQFKRIEGENADIFTQLRVVLKEARDLRDKFYGNSCDPYFVIGLFDKNVSRRKKKKPEPTPLHQFRTTVVKRNNYPVYNESFFYPLEQYQMKKCVLKIEAWDQDKWANDTALGEAYFNLKDVTQFLLEEPSKELDLNLKLEDSKTINGQLLLGLCYLPTSERMTITVLKATNLKIIDEKNKSNDFYVQAITVYGGKLFERRKTSSRQTSLTTANFHEMLMFDVPYTKINLISLALTVRSSTCQVPECVRNSQRSAMNKDTCIGKVVIGPWSRKNSITHWKTMIQSPRRQVVQWHELK